MVVVGVCVTGWRGVRDVVGGKMRRGESEVEGKRYEVGKRGERKEGGKEGKEGSEKVWRKEDRKEERKEESQSSRKHPVWPKEVEEEDFELGCVEI